MIDSKKKGKSVLDLKNSACTQKNTIFYEKDGKTARICGGFVAVGMLE